MGVALTAQRPRASSRGRPPEFSLEYASTVSGIPIGDYEVLAGFIMMGAESAPVVFKLESSSLFGQQVLDEERLRNLIAANL